MLRARLISMLVDLLTVPVVVAVISAALIYWLVLRRRRPTTKG